MGRPTMYLPGLLGLPCSPMERTLNRARRTAPQAMKTKETMSPRGKRRAVEAAQRPLVDEHRGRGAEGDDVGQGVDLEAEGALGLGRARYATVEDVEEHREDDEERGQVVVVLLLGRRRDADRVEAAEDRRQRDHVRQQEQGLLQIQPAPLPHDPRASTATRQANVRHRRRARTCRGASARDRAAHVRVGSCPPGSRRRRGSGPTGRSGRPSGGTPSSRRARLGGACLPASPARRTRGGTTRRARGRRG